MRAPPGSPRVVITEYDLARPTTEPHDIIVRIGAVWYTDFCASPSSPSSNEDDEDHRIPG